MTTLQEPTTPSGNSDSEKMSLEHEERSDVWSELFGIVQGLGEAFGLALQAFTPGDDKAVSAITKKRLALRSIQSLKQGQQGVQTLVEHLKALQAASQTWQRSMMFASKSHQELIEQLESTTEELDGTSERLRTVEAQRLTAVRDAEGLRARLAQQDLVIKDTKHLLELREEELENLQFTVHEIQAKSNDAQENMERLKQAAAQADERAQAASAGFNEVKADAVKAQTLADRHQQVVAKLTADNLMFLMQLKKAEADLAAANQERAQLRLAAEQQRGPWFDQVRAGVEERVRQALRNSQELESRLERQAIEHSRQVEVHLSQRRQLEEQLANARQQVEELQQQLDASRDAQQRAESVSAAAESATAELRQRLDDLAAENRVLQDSIKNMRQECTERWVNEQAALGRVGGLEERLQEHEGLLAQHRAQAAALQRQLDTQAGINRQLMARKEEVEWQLMAAMAKLDGGSTDIPVPLNLRVSGLLEVGGSRQQLSAEARGLAPGPASDCPTEENEPMPGKAGTGTLSAASHTEGERSTAARHAGQGFQSHDTACQPDPLNTADCGSQSTWQSRPGEPAAGSVRVSQLHIYNQQRAAMWGGGHSGTDAPVSTVSAVATGATADAATARFRSLASQPYQLGSITTSTPEDVAARGLDASPDAVLMPEPTLSLSDHRSTSVQHGDGDTAHPPLVSKRHDACASQPDITARELVDDGLVGTSTTTVSTCRTISTDAAPWRGVAEGSAAITSPPSSTSVSTEPDFPRGAGMGQVRNVQASTRISNNTVSIRTVSVGPRSPFAVERSSAAHDGGRQQDGHDVVTQPRQHSEAAKARAAEGLQDPIRRRGSLHDGDDVWLQDAVSTSSSDDIDALLARVGSNNAQRGTGATASARFQAPAMPHQALLHQLQQELQSRLQSPEVATAAGPDTTAVAWGSQPARSSGHGQGQPDKSSGSGMTPARSSLSPGHSPDLYKFVALGKTNVNDDDDFIIERRTAGISGDRSVHIRSAAIVMRTAPSQHIQASSRGSGASAAADTHQARSSVVARNNVSTGGAFDIYKGGSSAMLGRARGDSSGSPLHPAMSGAGVWPTHSAPAALSPTRSSRLQAAAAGSCPSSAAREVRALSVKSDDHASGAPHAEHAGKLMHRSEAPSLATLVQEGSPYYLAAAPQSSSTHAVSRGWANEPASMRQQDASLIPAAQQSYDLHVSSSPARSIKSPSSPSHPALIIRDDRSSSKGAGPAFEQGVLAVARSSASGEVPIAGLPGSRLEGYVNPMYQPARPSGPFEGRGMDVRDSKEVDSSSDSGSWRGLLASGCASRVPSETALSASGIKQNNNSRNVRFSDNNEPVHIPQQRSHARIDQECPGVASTVLPEQNVSNSKASAGREYASSSPDLQRLSAGSVGSYDSQGHRWLGSVQHPAIVTASPATRDMLRAAPYGNASDGAEVTPSKRYSGGFVTTAVPYAQHS